MAVFRFSALSDGQSLVFNPTADVLNFDQTTVAAADLRVTQVGSNIRIDVVSGTQTGKDVTLQNVSPLQLATTNVTFADGSKLLFGDNFTAQNDNLANSLTGTAGNDLLQGFGGADTMAGGAGNDTYIVSTGDVLSDTGGTDTVLSDVSWSLADGFENLTLTGTGNINATGNNAANFLVGNSGNNFFNPRGGDDTIQGGAGNDQVTLGGGGVASYGNKVIDLGAGFDRLDFSGFAKSAIVVDLGAGTLKGGGDAGQGSATLISIETVVGDGFNDQISGSAAAESLNGGAGNDTLDGRGGNDTLTGGLGADTFAFTTAPGAGNTDQVTDFVSATDKLSFDNNVFTGLGVAGNFTAGDPRFAAGPGFTSAHGGERLVYNTTTGQLFYTPEGDLSSPQLVATLQGAPALTATDIVVTGRGPIEGTAGNDSLTGTTGPDSISGLDGNDTIDGLGGADTIRGGDGDDTLTDKVNGGPDMPAQLLDGGLGNDTYDLRAFPFDARPAAVIVDAGGVDTVVTNHSFVLPDGIENLTLGEGTFGTGNALDNVIVTLGNEDGLHRVDGMGGNDTIIGGVARDEMTGGAGNDVFVFTQVPEPPSVRSDEVEDFASGVDRLQFDNNAFTQLGTAGNFTGGDARFASGAGLTSGQDASDRLVYNTSTGDLFYDADGNGAGGSILVAHLTGAPALAATDITVSGTAGSSIRGTAGNDSLAGTEGNDSIAGLAGNDTLDGLGGDDQLNEWRRGQRHADREPGRGFAERRGWRRRAGWRKRFLARQRGAYAGRTRTDLAGRHARRRPWQRCLLCPVQRCDRRRRRHRYRANGPGHLHAAGRL
jgi:Ca2+-binding RTX toxin-like protein